MQHITHLLKRKNSHVSIKTKDARNLAYIYRLLLPSPTSKIYSSKVPQYIRYAKGSKLAQVSSIALLSLLAQGTATAEITTKASDAYDNVMAMKTLTVASVQGDSTYFSTDGFQHGFGYDLTRAYAQDLGVKIKIRSFDSDEQALRAVALGKVDMALTTSSTLHNEKTGLTALNLSCGFDKKLIENGLHPKTSWSFRNNYDALAKQASHFLCNKDQLSNTAKIANFYDQTLLKDDYNRNHFEKALNKNLPNYQSSFKKQANNYDHDWQLLVAMGYQESHLNADAVSSTGVRGIMMLTSSTAKAMGVSNRIDPYQSIGGGAKYLEKMKDSFSNIPNPDRLWFALASYNMGPNAVKRVQKKVAASGQDPDSWSNVYAYLSDNASKNSRYVQCMHYVTNIRSYLESLKTSRTT